MHWTSVRAKSVTQQSEPAAGATTHSAVHCRALITHSIHTLTYVIACPLCCCVPV